MLKKITRRIMSGPAVRHRIANRPLLVLPQTARDTLNYVLSRKGLSATFHILDDEDYEGSDRLAIDTRGFQRKSGKTFHYANGIAVIPVEGTLVHKYGYVDPSCGMTGYDGIARKLQEAVEDSEVRGILLDIHSPGGEVDGCSDLAAQIRAARDKKPVWGIADSMAYSAAFWLGSQCSRLYVTDTGGVGSVGVVMQHVDWSKALAKDGVKVTLIHAGARKVDGNPYEPLPDEVRQEFQEECDALREKFAAAVAEGRGISKESVLGTEARCLTAAAALDIGFVDGVLPGHAIVQAFQDDLNGVKAAPRYTPTATTAQAEAAAAPPQPLSQESQMSDQTGAAAPLNANAADANQIKARIKSITNHEEAKGRTALAEHLAYDTDHTVEEAVAILKTAPKEAAQTGLSGAMAGQPEPGADGGERTGKGSFDAKDLDPATVYGRWAAAEPPVRFN